MRWALAYLLIVGLGCALALTVHDKYRQDIQRFQADYVEECRVQDHRLVDRVELALGLVDSALRIAAHLPTLSRETVQGLFQLMELRVRIPGYREPKLPLVSVIYVVRREFDPDETDPETGKPYVPTQEFRAGVKPAIGEQLAEWRALRDQVARLKSRPTDDSGGALSGEVESSDLSRFDPSHSTSADRTGVVYAIPVRDKSGRLVGAVGAVILTRTLADLISAETVGLGDLEPSRLAGESSPGLYALTDPGAGWLVLSLGAANREEAASWMGDVEPRDTLRYWMARAEPKPDQIHSQVYPISLGEAVDHPVSLWSGRDPDQFWSRPQVLAAGRFAAWGYATSVALTLGLVLFVAYVQRSQRAIESKNLALRNEVEERRAAEERMRRLRDQAEAASRAKSEFLANMSHEIRTPMNGILGMAALALKTPLEPVQREYLQAVFSSAEALMGILNDILDFSKIEAGALTLDPLAIQLRDLLDSSLKMLAVRAHEKGLEVTLSVDPAVDDWLTIDPLRLRQILLNLVGNAVKFTESGEVAVRVTLSRPGWLRLEVRDTGVGIPPARLDTIFDAFTQADTSTTRLYGGTGLGLAISSRLVKLMGGTIQVSSVPDEGSCFTVELPFSPAPAPAPTAGRARVALAGRRVLVVDDNATNRRYLTDLLKHWEMTPEAVEGVEQALDVLVRSHAEGQPFPLVLTDANMPVKDGFALAEAVQQKPELCGTVIMMLTSAGLAGDAERCRQLGIRAFLTKPVSEQELLNTVQRCLGGQAGEVVRSESEPLTVLVVEDNPVNRQLATILLERLGHRVTVACDGREAIELTETGIFDVILMDVQMPHVDGLEASRRIRAREKGQRTPIIALTAHAMKGDRERCLEAGMDGYLSKPITEEALAEGLAGLARRV